jgi:hypothetical protein
MTTWLPIAVVVVVAVIVLAVLRSFFEMCRVLRIIKRNSDEAHAFFSSHPEDWAVFNVARDAVPADQVPTSQGPSIFNILGPFEMWVPKLDRTVTVYGKSTQSLQSLDHFILRVKTRGKGQQSPEPDL